MRISIEHAITKAVMIGKPLIIVEGKDDLPIYNALMDGRDNLEIKPIECFDSCSSGCKEIERVVDNINSKYPAKHKVYNYFKGIVDLDAKKYRKEVCNKEGILYLNTYSFENSLVNKKSLSHLIKLLTNASEKDLNDIVFDIVIEKINENLNPFYYITLEALKNAVEPSYIGVIGFSSGYEKTLLNKDELRSVLSKTQSLDTFAEQQNINIRSILDMHSYCKGKWHLRYFIQEASKAVSTLAPNCGMKIKKCVYCENEIISKCIYKKQSSMKADDIIKAIKNNVDNAELAYLKAEIEQWLDS
ncbi:hypothetical protein [Aeromonas dhakensis]|uniref:hypothetical protein n=1 Tax=Aeromonas dhakensis TaxID=196024 RepID=UPI0038D0C522